MVGVGGERQMRKKDNFWLSSSVARGWSSFFFWHNLQGLPGGGRRKRRNWGSRILFLRSLVSFQLKRGYEPMVRFPRDK